MEAWPPHPLHLGLSLSATSGPGRRKGAPDTRTTSAWGGASATAMGVRNAGVLPSWGGAVIPFWELRGEETCVVWGFPSRVLLMMTQGLWKLPCHRPSLALKKLRRFKKINIPPFTIRTSSQTITCLDFKNKFYQWRLFHWGNGLQIPPYRHPRNIFLEV